MTASANLALTDVTFTALRRPIGLLFGAAVTPAMMVRVVLAGLAFLPRKE